MDNGASSYRRFLDGDESAFDEILDLYRDNLTFFINRYVRNITVAEDLAIDSFVELIVHKNRYNFTSSLKTYLFTIGRNRALDYLKHIRRIKTVPLDDADTSEYEREYASLEESVIAEERKRIVNKALETLPCEMKTAVYLVYFEGMSYDQTAAVMKKNRKQVDNLLYRAKNALRSVMGKEGELLL
ncbi:ECF RNA polymerase sigma-E factor [bioreactor metagenome]|uniref:ECF RNA polymerase sigma-E factor n=1 Tax=bioreactor metagenome TaxID=1076179 RepID=A0A645AHP5_9ZZZZ|nr:RNA polymerase sigma factor [Oscillospiraceae bacterium]